MKDLARIARKSATLYRELRRDVVRLAAEERPKKKGEADGNKSENRATRRLVSDYREGVRRLERTALLAATSENGGYYAELSAAAAAAVEVCPEKKARTGRAREMIRATPVRVALTRSVFFRTGRLPPPVMAGPNLRGVAPREGNCMTCISQSHAPNGNGTL